MPKLQQKLTYCILVFVIIFTISCKDNFETESFFLMGTFLSVTFQPSDGDHISNAVRLAHNIVMAIDNDTSSFNNAKPFERLNLSIHFYNLYILNKHYYNLSAGVFDPTAFTVAKLYGFPSGDFKIPKEHDLTIAKNSAGFDKIIEDNGTFYKTSNQCIDFGATGKGYIVDLMVIFLKSKGVKNFIINAGGDVFISGKKNIQNFTIGVTDPKNRAKPLTAIKLADKGIATSGNYERFFKHDNISINHIFSGITFNSVNNYSSVSVVAENALLADSLATLYYLFDVDKIKKFCEEFKTPTLIIDSENRKIELCNWR